MVIFTDVPQGKGEETSQSGTCFLSKFGPQRRWADWGELPLRTNSAKIVVERLPIPEQLLTFDKHLAPIWFSRGLCAQANFSLQVAELLLGAGAHLDARDASGCTPARWPPSWSRSWGWWWWPACTCTYSSASWPPIPANWTWCPTQALSASPPKLSGARQQ